MEFLVTTELNLPAGVDPAERDRLFAAERKRGFELKREGSIERIWRIPARRGARSRSVTLSIRPHCNSTSKHCPVFHWLKIEVIALAHHPIEDGE